MLQRARQRPSDQDWENHREELEKLYIKDNKALHEVMSYMETRYGFIAKYDAWLCLLCTL